MLSQTCYYCGYEGRVTRDHLIPRSSGGADDPSNIVPCCHRCNTMKGARTAAEFQAHLRETGALTAMRAADHRLHEARTATVAAAAIAPIARDIGAQGVAVYLALRLLTGEEQIATVFQRQIADLAGASRRTVQRMLEALNAAGFIEIILTNDPLTNNTVNTYVVKRAT